MYSRRVVVVVWAVGTKITVQGRGVLGAAQPKTSLLIPQPWQLRSFCSTTCDGEGYNVHINYYYNKHRKKASKHQKLMKKYFADAKKCTDQESSRKYFKLVGQNISHSR